MARISRSTHLDLPIKASIAAVPDSDLGLSDDQWLLQKP
jgi:hypothetical protein